MKVEILISKLVRDNSDLDYFESGKDGERYTDSGICFEGKLIKFVGLVMND